MSLLDEKSPAGEHSDREREKRYRLYGKAYKFTLALLWHQQGSQCFYRFEGCLNKPQAIAHKDHDRNNWEVSNLAASCTHCNAVISNQARTKIRSAKIRVSEIERGIAPGDNIVGLSDRMQRDFDDWLMRKLGPGGEHRLLPLKVVVKEASFDCRVSTVTLRRYLVDGPFTASNAAWRLVERHLLDDPPGVKTLCVMWAHRPLDEELSDALYRVGRKEFVAELAKEG